jgi:adenylate cyclase
LAGANGKAKFVAGVLFSMLAGVALVAASRSNMLPAAPDKFTYDWRTYFLSERAVKSRDDIVIIEIDEESLQGYNYLSPIDRGLVAELVKFVDAAGAKAIGLDLIFDRRTEPAKDDALADAIRKSKSPVVLGAVDGRAEEEASGLANQEAFFAKAKRPTGHIYFGAEQNRLMLGDQAVRFMLPASSAPPYWPSFTRLLAEVDGKKPEPASNFIYWRRPPAESGQELFPILRVPPHRDDSGKPAGAAFPDYWRELIAGRTVLIGGAFSDRDRHLTPLTVATQTPIPGVEIHAQILAQLRDGRSIYQMSAEAEFLAVAAVALCGFFAAHLWSLRGDSWIASAIAFSAIVAAGALLFWSARYIVPSATLFLAWASGLFIGNWADSMLERLGGVSGSKATSAARG